MINITKKPFVDITLHLRPKDTIHLVSHTNVIHVLVNVPLVTRTPLLGHIKTMAPGLSKPHPGRYRGHSHSSLSLTDRPIINSTQHAHSSNHNHSSSEPKFQILTHSQLSNKNQLPRLRYYSFYLVNKPKYLQLF